MEKEKFKKFIATMSNGTTYKCKAPQAKVTVDYAVKNAHHWINKSYGTEFTWSDVVVLTGEK